MGRKKEAVMLGRKKLVNEKRRGLRMRIDAEGGEKRGGNGRKA